jgi:DNA-binding GntR family transcriptional regulator
VSSVPVPEYGYLERPSLRDQVRCTLRTSIITGEIEAGRLYTVGAFASRLGVSATPVREALSDLANSGLVEIKRNRGFVVPPVTDHDLDEIFELRLMLEVPAVERISGQLARGERDACRRYVQEGKAGAAKGDLIGFLEADRMFHLTLLSALGNERLVLIIDRLRDQARLYGLPQLATGGRLVASAEEHESLLDAAEAGDSERAREEMRRHLLHTRGTWAGRPELS